MVQPAPQQRRQRIERLKAVGHQCQLTFVFGKQGRETGDAEIARPLEIRNGGVARRLGIEAVGELDARYACRLGQLDKFRRQRDVAPFDVEGPLDQPSESPCGLMVKITCRNQRTAGRLGVVDQPFRQTCLKVEGLATRLMYRMPVGSGAVTSGLVHRGTFLTQAADHEIGTDATCLRLLDQCLHDRRKAPAP